MKRKRKRVKKEETEKKGIENKKTRRGKRQGADIFSFLLLC